MKLDILLTLVSFLTVTASFSCDESGRSGITIENDLWIGPNDKSANNLTKVDFNKAIDEVVEIYEEIVSSKGAKLKVKRLWDVGVVNAVAKREENVWEVIMFGGLARHKSITVDGFTLVVCHELGHHLGGAPRKIDWKGETRWASNEGQADYWGVNKCFRKLMEKRGDSQDYVQSLNSVDPDVKKLCQSQFNDSNEDIAICIRSAYAGKSLASMFYEIRKPKEDEGAESASVLQELAFMTKDQNIVEKTFHRHPMPQCRLDTYLSSALCPIKSFIDTDNDDPNIGTCNRQNGDELGVRPLCWFRPKS